MFTRIDHVGIAVADLESALRFYTATLGLRAVHEEVNVEQGVREVMLAADDGARVQLLAPLTPDSPIARFLDKRGPGIQQLAFATEDVEMTATQLREKGIRLLYEESKTGTEGCRINFIHPHDAGGVLIELVERPSRP